MPFDGFRLPRRESASEHSAMGWRDAPQDISPPRSVDDHDPTLLANQIDFYEADARSYQIWLDDLGNQDNQSADAVAFRDRRRRLVDLIDRLGPSGRILEIAAGTGRFSTLVAPYASELTVVDSSPTSLTLARERLTPLERNIKYVLADIFDWEPDEAAYDVVCFAAWLHHVPLPRFAAFWATVQRALAPDGWVMFDFADANSAPATVPPPAPSAGYAVYHDPARSRSVRDHDGIRWTVVHQLWEPSRLEHRLRQHGWRIDLQLTQPDGFHWATAQRDEHDHDTPPSRGDTMSDSVP